MQGMPGVLERLTAAVIAETRSALQYEIHAALLDNWGLAKLAAHERSEAKQLTPDVAKRLRVQWQGLQALQRAIHPGASDGRSGAGVRGGDRPAQPEPLPGSRP